MGLALILIIFKGSSSDGQGNILSNILTTYIDETAAAVVTTPSQNQLADINSLVAYAQSERMPKPSVLNTIQGDSVVSRGTILTDIIDQFTDRGTQVSTYTVQEGDTLSFIASDYGVSVNTILWANSDKIKSVNDVKPGMELRIPPVTGVIHKVQKGDTVTSVAKKYSVDEQKIISFNSLSQGTDLQVGDEIIVPDGKMQNPAPKSPGYAVLKRFANLPSLAGYFGLPTEPGYRISQGLHGRNAVDLSNSCGTPLLAAADGIVNMAQASGWNGGYGKVIRISHPNGTETLYAHAMQILVDTSQSVAKGQEIGLMGSTGNSTGCHVHFEVHGARNPLAKY